MPTHCHPHRSRLVDCDFDGGNDLIGAGNIIQAVLYNLWLFCPCLDKQTFYFGIMLKIIFLSCMSQCSICV